ncbi:MAG: trifunctional histidinol dehydrogenase [Chaenotheca gracillima]|nr:MAG: trifunctional histidinol dehydrogenase [Chaenotheca gracillima]
MIPEEVRFIVLEASYDSNNTAVQFTIRDADQRRTVSVTSNDPKAFLNEDADAVKYLSWYINELPQDVNAITVTEDGDIESVSTGPGGLLDPYILYPLYPGPWAENEVLRRTQLEEVDRLSWCVDLVQEKAATTQPAELKVFKYTFINDVVAAKVWDEMQITKAISGHSNLVKFHRVILDDKEARLVGFTQDFVPNEVLKDNRSRPFRFSWLQQLTNVVDYLNLNLGIAHQDVAARNIAIDPTTGCLILLDLGEAAQIGRERFRPGRSDVDGVILTLWEILTELEPCQSRFEYDSKEIARIENLTEWPVKATLEKGQGGVEAYRGYLAKWAAERRTTRAIKDHSEATDPLFWPEPPKEISPFRNQMAAKAAGLNVVDWRRPPQNPSNPEKGPLKAATIGVLVPPGGAVFTPTVALGLSMLPTTPSTRTEEIQSPQKESPLSKATLSFEVSAVRTASSPTTTAVLSDQDSRYKKPDNNRRHSLIPPSSSKSRQELAQPPKSDVEPIQGLVNPQPELLSSPSEKGGSRSEGGTMASNLGKQPRETSVSKAESIQLGNSMKFDGSSKLSKKAIDSQKALETPPSSKKRKQADHLKSGEELSQAAPSANSKVSSRKPLEETTDGKKDRRPPQLRKKRKVAH